MDNDVAKDIVKELAKDVYADGGKPIVGPTSELVGLVPRAVKAALAPLEQWILQREYNVAETKKLLEEKLKNVPPELIEPPEAHIAVPAMQYISYCMDNHTLRDMYANLLANSMNRVIKNGVHPGFVEIIRQLSPDEAKILKFLSSAEDFPTIKLCYVDDDENGYEILKNFSNVGDLTNCERPLDIAVYFDNLSRLGLVRSGEIMQSYTDKTVYEPLKTHPYILQLIDKAATRKDQYNNVRFFEGYIAITDYGKAFCGICLNTAKTVISTDITELPR